ncbi:hypothetical protein KDA23_03845 [Candidatus Saccharibacteria bacterium]|nr:hypothetical protein [Candidatus Saccharibacteria bacterium]
MKKDLPESIKEVGFDFNWSNPKVWALTLPTEDIPIADLVWHFEYPFIWPLPDGYDEVTPNQVMDDPDTFKDEYQRTLDADISYPIDIMFWKNRWLILDGLHRLMKQYLNHAETVQVRKVPQSFIPQILKDL